MPFLFPKNKRETANGKNARPDFPDALSKETKKEKTLTCFFFPDP